MKWFPEQLYCGVGGVVWLLTEVGTGVVGGRKGGEHADHEGRDRGQTGHQNGPVAVLEGQRHPLGHRVVSLLLRPHCHQHKRRVYPHTWKKTKLNHPTSDRILLKH